MLLEAPSISTGSTGEVAGTDVIGSAGAGGVDARVAEVAALVAEFSSQLTEWERLVDEDGAHRSRETAHRNRDVRFITVGATVLLRGSFAGLQAEALQTTFAAFVDAEYRFDVEEARERLGHEHVTPGDLARTNGQRRAEAMKKLFEAAAIAPLNGRDIDLTVNIIIDQATFERQLLDLLDPLHLHRNSDADTTLAPDCQAAVDTHTIRPMCHTSRGTDVDPVDAVAAALVGHVRRVVVGAAGVIIDQGRRSRLYRGNSREAAYLQAAVAGQFRCMWPGCGHLPRQIDHVTPSTEGGPTSPRNAGPMCGRHNLVKNTGFTTRRDTHGHWHVYRPDGTELARG
ncbi:hypothetical protein [Desertimonas flava]|uniref:hypothetical protein n=1 Tax=Desertimonas flava TaxID=2064846 RepID=UPI000E349F56|nr:hypothetical protein [Desertimonas flava]